VPGTTDPKAMTNEELLALLKRAEQGDVSTLPVLREVLRDPAMVRPLGGDLAELAQLYVVGHLSGKDLACREAIVRRLDLFREELLGSDPTPVERLLVERVVACWLHVQEADIRYAEHSENCSFAQADFDQRRLDAANKRYLAALKTLALVRKLAAPVLQVNIARKQVNVAGTVVTPDTRPED
jgi:hypothetical protein